jgi:acetolactate synthase I/II/III large subunit
METHAEVMARTMAARGVDTVFGLPGGEILAFVAACRRAGVRFLLTGHEASAGWMAQVTGQLTGTPGVCASTLGPGAANLVTAVANAWLDRAPMVAVTAQIPQSAIGTMTHQRLPLGRLFAPITKGSFRVGDCDTAGLVNRAFEIASAPRFGPVHISLASDIATQEYQATEVAASEPVTMPDGDIREIARRIDGAARPLVLVGLGAEPVAAHAIAALIEKLQCPFMVTPKVKGIVAEDHPRFAGVVSGMALDREMVEIVRAADLVVGIGFDPVECDKGWFSGLDVVAIDNASMVEGANQPREALGDIPTLTALLSELVSSAKPWAPPAQPKLPVTAAQAGMVSPLRLIETLRAVFPRDGIVSCDVGSHKLAMGQFWRSYLPGTFLMSNGLSGMGFGIPAAIAAQLVHPGSAVMAVVGDGGMLMMLHDLVMIRELGLPIVIVVLVDGSLSLIRLSGERRGMAPYGVDFTPPDFVGAAQAFGIQSAHAGSLQDARGRLERALSERAPFLLEVPVDAREYAEVIR